MKVLYRLSFYLGGFSVGLVLLTFIFNGKKTSCNYTPNARVIDNLLQKEVFIPENIKMDYPELTDSLLQTYIRKGTIDFSKSDTKRDSCRLYYIHLGSIEKAYMEVTNCAKTISLVTFVQP